MLHGDSSHKETASAKAEREKYEAEEDVRMLVRADEIRKDKPRLKRATAMAKTQLTALTKVTK